MIRKWPFSTIFLWIIANKQEFDLYWCEFEIALYPGIQGRGYKTLRFRLYCNRYCKYLILVIESTWAIAKSFITGCLYPPNSIYWSACTKPFISLFVKLKYLRQINPSTLAALLLHCKGGWEDSCEEGASVIKLGILRASFIHFWKGACIF